MKAKATKDGEKERRRRRRRRTHLQVDQLGFHTDARSLRMRLARDNYSRAITLERDHNVSHSQEITPYHTCKRSFLVTLTRDHSVSHVQEITPHHTTDYSVSHLQEIYLTVSHSQEIAPYHPCKEITPHRTDSGLNHSISKPRSSHRRLILPTHAQPSGASCEAAASIRATKFTTQYCPATTEGRISDSVADDKYRLNLQPLFMEPPEEPLSRGDCREVQRDSERVRCLLMLKFPRCACLLAACSLDATIRHHLPGPRPSARSQLRVAWGQTGDCSDSLWCVCCKPGRKEMDRVRGCRECCTDINF